MSADAPKTLGIVHRPGCTKADVVQLCECGANVVCRTCRWGRGAWPCACQQKPDVDDVTRRARKPLVPS